MLLELLLLCKHKSTRRRNKLQDALSPFQVTDNVAICRLLITGMAQEKGTHFVSVPVPDASLF
jgi:hypothetical protein